MRPSIWRQFQIALVTLAALQLAPTEANYAALHYQHQNGFSLGNNFMQQSPPLQSQQQQSQQPQQQQQPPLNIDLESPPPLSPLLSQRQSLQPTTTNNNNQEFPSSHSSRSTDGLIIRYQGTAINSTTVKLIWSLRSGYQADSFDIEWGPIPDATNSFSVKGLNGTARDYTLHQLQPDTHYQFQLQGRGANLYKPMLVEVKTPPANFVARPQDHINRDIMPLGVKAEAKSNSSIQLSWTEPERPASIKNSSRVNIIRYYINPSLSPASSGTNTQQADNNTTATPQYHYLNVTNARDSRLIVQRLKPATEYAFAVKTAYYTPDMKKIFTQSGFSMDTLAKTYDLEPSAPRNFTIQTLPATKEELLAGKTGKLELNWAPPESPNGQLRGYTILYAHEPSAPEEHWQQIEVNGANINNWFVADPKAGHSYYFKVRAINQKGAGPDSETRLYNAPSMAPYERQGGPIPPNNVLLLIAICMLAILFLLSLVVSRLACGSRRKPRKGSLNTAGNGNQKNASGPMCPTNSGGQLGAPKLNGFASTNSGVSSTVAARVGTLARRRDNAGAINGKPDFWISAMGEQPEIKSNGSERSVSDVNMAMVSIQRDSPQFATTQLAPALPEYRFAANNQDQQQQQLMQQLQPQSHYHPGQLGTLGYDQMDNATASALMTLSKRQQQQLQKYQIQFASTAGMGMGNPNQQQQQQQPNQAPSPHQQPPPPPPLNIEQQQQQQSLYGTHHQTMANTRSLRLHRPTLYDPVSGSFVQGAPDNSGPPQYHMHSMMQANNPLATQFGNNNSNTLQFHPHQTSTLLSRRSTNTLRSFQTSNATYGQLAGAINGASQFAQPFGPIGGGGGQQQQQQQQQPILQSHQAVINQLNNSSYPSLPLKHVSAVRPQIMSSLEDQIEMELAEKEQQLNGNSANSNTQQSDTQQTIKQ